MPDDFLFLILLILVPYVTESFLMTLSFSFLRVLSWLHFSLVPMSNPSSEPAGLGQEWVDTVGFLQPTGVGPCYKFCAFFWARRTVHICSEDLGIRWRLNRIEK
jgi:hypothetical protein